MNIALQDPDVTLLPLQSNRHGYLVGEAVRRGYSFTVLPALMDGDTEVVLKVARTDSAAARLLAEGEMLERIHSVPELDEIGGIYFPRFIETISVRDEHGASFLAGVHTTIDDPTGLDIVRTSYPTGVDARDMAWMMRRLLMALGFAHQQGVVHGAVVPRHLLIQAGDHGLLLVDWTHATYAGAPVPERWTAEDLAFLAPEVRHGGRVCPGTDLYMAAGCMRHLMGDQPVPDEISELLDTLQDPAALRRPQDAWEVKDSFDRVITDLWGPLTFRPFPIT